MIASMLMAAALAAQPQQGAQPAATPEARRAVEIFAACVADASPEKAAATLRMDFTGQAYQSSIRVVTRVNEDCLRRTRENWLRANALLIAGGMAERLLEAGTQPVKVQLAYAAARPAVKSYSPSDAGAGCVVRSAPDDVAMLFATEVGSPEESAAAAPLGTLIERCLGGRPTEISVAGLRAILATAAFRSVHSEASN